MKHVILDTDPGVDDALAIILAMSSPELKVEAITTVSGNVNVDLCTRNVRRILEILEPETPPIIARGESAPLVKREHRMDASEVHGKDGLGDLDLLKGRYPEPTRYPVSPDHAVDVILSLIAEHPHQITLIAVGPLTNVARAVERDIERMRKVKEIIIMGGAFSVPGNVTAVAEFNIFTDPHAADIVVNSGLPITFVGLDVTHQVLLRQSRIRSDIELLNNRISRFVCDITRVYINFHKEIDGVEGFYLHDPLAVGVAIDPELVQTEDVYVQVETQGKITSGMTVGDRRAIKRYKSKPNVSVCTKVNTDKFLTLFLNAVK